MTHATVTIQITSESKLSTPSWMGEVAAIAQILEHTGTLKVVQNQVRFARARFGHYALIDFVAVLIGYILPSEPTLLAFYERLAPFAEPFMALFGRNRLPHRSTLSRFLAALDPASVEGLRSLFQKDWLVLYPWLSRFRVYAAARWNSVLPCQSPSVSPGTASRARWFPTDLVCCTHWSLSFLPLADAMSGE